MRVALAVIFAFLGCGINQVVLELLVKDNPHGGNLVTFCQFFFIAIEGIIFTSKFGKEPRKISIKAYFIMTVMFFVVSIFNNLAFSFKIPMPLHMIFRSGTLITNMIMGIVILKKEYPLYKYLSVLMVTVGIIICTLLSGKEVKSEQREDSTVTGFSDIFWWSIGIIMLTVALLISGRMGIYQETLYKRYGKHSKEAMFYTHLLPLPLFTLLSKDLYDQALVAWNSPTINVPFTSFDIPRMIVYLIGNVISQYMCISSIFILTTECTSLTVTLIVTLRKFTSLVLSILYFNYDFTIYHWFGTMLVFTGTILFTEVVPKIKNALMSKDKVKKIE